LAKKDLHDERLDKGLAALLSAGIAPKIAINAPTSASVAQLKSAIGRSPEADIAAIFLLGKIAAQESLNLIREIETTATDKDVKKEIKRALFKLRQKGIVVPQEPPEEKKSGPLFGREYEIEAYMSAVDGGGGRLVWIAKPQPKRGLQVIQAMLHDRDGLVRFGGVQMKRKELRAMADEIKQKHGVSMIAVPWEYADRIIYEGYESAKARGQSGQSDLSDFHAIRSVIGTGKPKADTHPIYQKLGTEDFRDGSWREQSRRLLEEPELRYWVIVDEWVQDSLAALHEAQSSPLVLNPVQKEERLASVVRDAVKTLCAGDNGQAFKRRMEDMALYFAETDRLEQAKVSLAVAQQVGEGDPGPLDISFLTGLMQKSFVFFMAQMKAQQEAQQKAEQSSLIVKP
jgi:hypothetical protein